MSVLSKFLLAFFGGLVEYFAKRVGLRIARMAAFTTAYVGILTLLWLSLKASILGLVYFVDNPYLIMGFWLVWPDNAEAILAAIVTTDVTLFIYRVHVENVRMLAYVT